MARIVPWIRRRLKLGVPVCKIACSQHGVDTVAQERFLRAEEVAGRLSLRGCVLARERAYEGCGGKTELDIACEVGCRNQELIRELHEDGGF
jgi:hypothetical protein